MKEYRINGVKKLYGEVSVSGGKNAVLPILAATVLNSAVSVIHNCPRISDTYYTLDILRALGCKADIEGSTIIVDSAGLNDYCVPKNLASEMRSSIMFLGSLIGRVGKACVSHPGGCVLGVRPINLHTKALKELGANISDEYGDILCDSSSLKGARIYLDFPSVGATENIMLAAVLAEGITIISNAAKEPEIVDLQRFLNNMGAKIKGAGTDTIVIDGVKKLHSAEHTVMPDRIVAGTYLTAAAATKGEIHIKNVIPSHLYPVSSKLAEAGCIIREGNGSIYIKAPERLTAVDKIITQPHPGFPTDMQPQFMALLSTASGTSVIIETVFEARMKHVGDLVKLGADIVLSNDGMTAVVKGVDKLKASDVTANDLRGGAALIIAGLGSEGETVVRGVSHVERGYEDIIKDIISLGGDIKLLESSLT